MKKKSTYITPHKLYILMRNDLPSMNPGKAMAQSAHAANQFIHSYSNDANVKKWQTEGRGFGTTIVLAVDKAGLLTIQCQAERLHVHRGTVHDTTYPFIVDTEICELMSKWCQTSDPIYKENGKVIMFRDEITCGYLFIADNSPYKETLVGSLPLYP